MNPKKNNFSLLVIAILLSHVQLNAIPAYPLSLEYNQPDGSKVSYLLKGDEHFKFRTTLDGYLLTQDSLKNMTYAIYNQDGIFVSTHVRANNIEKRKLNEKEFIRKLTQHPDLSSIYKARKNQNNQLQKISAPPSSTKIKSFPLSGNQKSIVILVNFSDLNYTISSPKTAFWNLLNQVGYSTNGATGSAADYFKNNSTNKFSPEFDVVGPFTLPKTMDYYGKNDIQGNDTNPREMVIDACTLASNNGVDFSQYDTDKDGYVDNIFIYYAGYNEAEGGPANSIWPHRWTVNSTQLFNGVQIHDYACTSELRSSFGTNMCGIGTFCHEFGHVLGLPDYYNTNDSKQFTLSDWNIMDGGAYLNRGRTPPAYSAWDRFYLDWLKPIVINTGGSYTLDTLISSNKAYIISPADTFNSIGSNPKPNEFFTLENRQKKGWDAYLPGHGMLVTHIYFNQSDWDANTPNNNPSAMDVDIIEADGIASENTLPGDPFPGIDSIKSCNLILRNKNDIHKPLKNIYEKNGIISFYLGININVSGSFQNFSTVQGTPSATQSIIVSGKKLADTLKISFAKTNSNYEMKKNSESGNNWRKSISLVPIDSIVDSTIIDVRYNPSVPSYTKFHTDTLLLNSALDTYSIDLTGKSSRPVYVVPPVANEARDIKLASFVGSWDQVFDATGYYVFIFKSPENILVQSKWVTTNIDTIYNLTPGTDYVYKVKASDKNDSLQYENITDFSNGINFTTLPYPSKKQLIVYAEPNGDIIAVLPTLNSEIEIFDATGKLILSKIPTTNPFTISELQKGNMIYIIRYNEYVGKILLK